MTTHTDLAAQAERLAALLEREATHDGKADYKHAAARVMRELAALSTERLAGGGEPYGRVTVVRRPGCVEQHYFYRWPDPPYLDNAAECHTVYTTPPPQAERLPLSSKQRKHSCDDPLCAVCGHGIGTPKESRNADQA